MGDKDKAYVKLFDVDLELSARRITEISYTMSQQVDGSVALLVLTVVPGLDRPAHQVILRSSDSPEENGSEPSSALSSVAGQSPGKHFYMPVWTREYASIDGEGKSGVWVKKTYRLGGMIWDQKHIVEIGVLCTKKKTNTSSTGQASLDRTYHACIGEVCVVGQADVRNRASLGTIAAEPKRCANARITNFRRFDSSNVAFRVEWQVAEEAKEAVQYVLVFLHERTDSQKRTLLLGKSFGSSFEVERCLWKQDDEASSSLLHLELVSVSWTGSGASADGCNVYVDQEENSM